MILSPSPKLQFFDNNGNPLVGGQLFTYESGTVTPIVTYKDVDGNEENTNPIVLDFRGEANIWLVQGTSYTYVLSPATDTNPPTNPIWTVNGISLPSSGGGGGSLDPCIVELGADGTGTFGGSNFSSWVLNSSIATSADVAWDDDNSQFQFATAGKYRVTFQPGVSGNPWPDALTFYGSVLDDSKASRYSRYQGDTSEYSPEVPMLWTDEFYFIATDSSTLTVGAYASNYLHASGTASFTMFITIQRMS
jgi:hypothetical protein